MRKRTLFVGCVAAFAALGGGCSAEEEETGTLAVEIWGEAYAESGIPAEVFVDGWSVRFDRFLVAVGGITAARGTRAPEFAEDAQRVFDLVRPGPHRIAERAVPAGRYDNTGYRTAPAGPGAIAGNATAEDVRVMRDGRYAVYVEGAAQRGTITKTFRWGFTTDATFRQCESQALVPAGGSATIQITIHSDHLFVDDLAAEEPDVTFAVLARADSDMDDEIEQTELAAFDITALPNYGTGSEDIDNLWDFLSALAGLLGHIDGEGHCRR
ncbi:MAG: hypothetical protein QME96_12605 [Myxococcota bacterium]|nr:hypothetical protein [Myxococcota bacterium]